MSSQPVPRVPDKRLREFVRGREIAGWDRDLARDLLDERAIAASLRAERDALREVADAARSFVAMREGHNDDDLPTDEAEYDFYWRLVSALDALSTPPTEESRE